MDIDKYTNDHVQILRAVTDLKALAKGGIAQNADPIAKSIVGMSATIKLHLAAEDRYVYPTLANSANPVVANLGTKFLRQMGGIAAAYAEFAGKWNRAASVAADPEGFREHANAIFKALHERIQRENEELYPLAAKA
jgi:hypothetical protein